MKAAATGRHGLAAAIAVAALIALSACREDEDQTLPSASDQAVQTATLPDWLEATEDEAPLAFLARVTETPPDRIAPLLDRAVAAYGDSPRMVANRAAQLWHEIGQKDDSPVAIEALLEQLAAGGGADRPSIGPVIQHYRVLRAQGAGHAAAIQAATAEGRTP